MNNRINVKAGVSREEVIKALLEGNKSTSEILVVCLAEPENKSKTRLYIQNNLTEADEYIEVESDGTVLIPQDNYVAAEWVLEILESHGISVD